MRALRLLGLLVATATISLLMPAAAHAEPYPPIPPGSSVSDGNVTDGDSVIFKGKGFLAYEDISITVTYGGSDSTAALTGSPGGFVLAAVPMQRRAINTTADAGGRFSVRLKLTELGTATLTATGGSSGVRVTQYVEVTISADDSDDGDNGALPTTGSDGRIFSYTLYGGVGAILLGAGAVWLARSRRRPTP